MAVRVVRGEVRGATEDMTVLLVMVLGGKVVEDAAFQENKDGVTPLCHGY